MDRSTSAGTQRPRRAKRPLAGVLVACVIVGACGDDGESTAPDEDLPTSTADGDDDVAVGTFPTRAPEVSGAVAVDDDVVRLVEPSDTYFDQMVLVARAGDDAVLVVDEGGDEVALDDLDDGMLVDVWVADGCDESYPVQCDVEALRVDLGS